MCWEAKKRFVLIGDAYCGKTTMAARLSQIPIIFDEYIPTDFDDFSAVVSTKYGRCELTLLDTCGEHEDVSDVRSMAYKGCDAVIICFDLTDQSTLESVEAKWVPEVIQHCPGVPVYIAGCKRDAMCDGAEGCVCGERCCTQTEKDVVDLIERTGAVAYTECSARTGESVDELFQVAAETAAACKKTSAKKLVASLKKKVRKLSRPSRA